MNTEATERNATKITTESVNNKKTKDRRPKEKLTNAKATHRMAKRKSRTNPTVVYDAQEKAYIDQKETTGSTNAYMGPLIRLIAN